MSTSATEMQELRQMRDNIRRSVQALELCWSCQSICDGEAVIIGDGPPVSLCSACSEQVGSTAKERGQRMLPAPQDAKAKAGTV